MPSGCGAIMLASGCARTSTLADYGSTQGTDFHGAARFEHAPDWFMGPMLVTTPVLGSMLRRLASEEQA